MKVNISELKSKNFLELEETIEYIPENYSHVFSLRHVGETKVQAECTNLGEIIEVKLHIVTKLVLACSYTLEDVDYPIDITESLEFSESPINEEILPLNGNEICLDEYVLSLIVAHIPIRVIKKGAKLPQVKGVEVKSQEEFEEQQKNKLDPRLAALDNWEE